MTAISDLFWGRFGRFVFDMKLRSTLPASWVFLPFHDRVTLAAFRAPIAHGEFPVFRGIYGTARCRQLQSNGKRLDVQRVTIDDSCAQPIPLRRLEENIGIRLPGAFGPYP